MPRYTHPSQMPFIAPPVHIDHSAIPADCLELALRNEERSPWQKPFPWEQDVFPLAGSTVYHAGHLYTPYGRVPNDPLIGSCYELVKLCGAHYHDELVVARRCDLRPVSWTQADEDALQERQRCRFVTMPFPEWVLSDHVGSA
jgi:hypothetical protein